MQQVYATMQCNKFQDPTLTYPRQQSWAVKVCRELPWRRCIHGSGDTMQCAKGRWIAIRTKFTANMQDFKTRWSARCQGGPVERKKSSNSHHCYLLLTSSWCQLLNSRFNLEEPPRLQQSLSVYRSIGWGFPASLYLIGQSKGVWRTHWTDCYHRGGVSMVAAQDAVSSSSSSSSWHGLQQW